MAWEHPTFVKTLLKWAQTLIPSLAQRVYLQKWDAPHGLRVSELCALRWDQVNLNSGLLHVRRLKHGIPSVHLLRGPELRALRKLKRESKSLAYFFVTEQGEPITAAGFRKLFSRIAQDSSMSFSIHPHMLRHACGYKLINDGQDVRAI